MGEPGMIGAILPQTKQCKMRYTTLSKSSGRPGTSTAAGLEPAQRGRVDGCQLFCFFNRHTLAIGPADVGTNLVMVQTSTKRKPSHTIYRLHTVNLNYSRWSAGRQICQVEEVIEVVELCPFQGVAD